MVDEDKLQSRWEEERGTIENYLRREKERVDWEERWKRIWEGVREGEKERENYWEWFEERERENVNWGKKWEGRWEGVKEKYSKKWKKREWECLKVKIKWRVKNAWKPSLDKLRNSRMMTLRGWGHENTSFSIRLQITK